MTGKKIVIIIITIIIKKIEGIFSEERLTQADFYVERKGGEREGLEN